MAQNGRDLEGNFIATVKGYNKITRELEVYIPKLMPSVPIGQKELQSLTNLGNTKLNFNYSKYIKTKSTIKVKAEDTETPLPDIGSHVLVYFLENDYNLGLWRRFNANSDFEVIPEEKYKKYFDLKVGNSKIAVHQDDYVIVEIPDDFKTVVLTEEKTKRIVVQKTTDLESEITDIKNQIGNASMYVRYTDNNGNAQTQQIPASGILKTIEDLEKRISELEKGGAG